MTNLLIEGWRGVNHSFALVNQCQILELLKFDDLTLFHRDLPYAMPHWTARALDAGFSAPDRARIEALREPGETKVDAIYRITSPFRADPACQIRTVTFMVTELGVSNRTFEPGAEDSDFFTRDQNSIVTTTHWSRDRLIEHGLDGSKIRVVPCGVRSDTFFPMTTEERSTVRASLGIKPDEMVFLNLGAPMWNKGMDVLLLAFARLRQRHANAKLLLKDQRGLYGISVDQMLKDLTSQHPALFTTDTLAALQVVPGNLSQAQLRQMYGLADVYVSAYRAEGFNLPVLEAIACGTPVVVTDGGATDDFCADDVAWRVASTPLVHSVPSRTGVGRYHEPDGAALVEAMHAFCTGPGLDRTAFARGRQRVIEQYTWQNAARSLHELLVPTAAPAALAEQALASV